MDQFIGGGSTYLIGLITVFLGAVWVISVGWRKRRHVIASREPTDDFEIGDYGFDLSPVAALATAIVTGDPLVVQFPISE